MRRLALPGLAAAAFTNDLEPPSLPEITPKAVRDLTLKLEEGLRAHQGKADENTLLAAQQRLERDLSGTFDVTPRIDDGVRLVTLSDATGSRSIAQAAVGLDQAAATGRSALTDRERDVFTEFVLGGVAEELRRRLNQAGELVDAMNASLAEIRTSHGIGVKLRWKLDDDSDRTAEPHPGAGRDRRAAPLGRADLRADRPAAGPRLPRRSTPTRPPGTRYTWPARWTTATGTAWTSSSSARTPARSGSSAAGRSCRRARPGSCRT